MTAWWADWKESEIEPVPGIPIVDNNQPISSSTTTSIITCTGKPQFKIGGSAKTFTVTYYNEDNEIIPDHAPGEWTFAIDGTPVDSELLTLTPDGNKLKIKFLGDDSYIGKILTITNTGIDEYFRTVTSEFQVEIIAL